MLETYCTVTGEANITNKERPEILEEEAFLHYSRQLTQELEHVLALPFVKFWAEMTKDSQVIDFLDAFLFNMRKRNDTYKLQAGALKSSQGVATEADIEEVKAAFEGGGVLTSKDLIRNSINRLLCTVLKIFYRLSKPIESEKDYFALSVYNDLVYNNWLFDIAKLYDLIAVYGKSNPEAVKGIVLTVFENDKRYVQDFKEGVDTIITMLKKNFSSSSKVSDMIMGAGVIMRTRAEQDDIIRRLMLDFVEIMTNVELTTIFFPESMLETLRSTSLPLFMANVFCLMAGPVKKLWMRDSHIKAELNTLRKQVQKVAIDTCLSLLDIAITRLIGVHSQHYAVVQNTLASCLKQFIMGLTGNVELSKEFLHRNSNFMVSNDSNKLGCRFMRRILSEVNPATGSLRVNFVQSIMDFEERFLSEEDKTFLIRILKSLARGNLVQVKKMPQPMHTVTAQ